MDILRELRELLNMQGGNAGGNGTDGKGRGRGEKRQNRNASRF